MKKHVSRMLAGAAVIAAGSASAADLSPVYRKAPMAPAPSFSWSGCHIGARADLGTGHTSWQDASTPGDIDANGFGNTANTDMSGALYGGQIGCDYQFPSSLVLGVEGAVSGATMKGSTLVALPDSPPDTALVTVKTDFMPTLTGRIGYAADRWLFYAKGGVAWSSNKYSVVGTFNGGAGLGLPFDFEGLSVRTGWTAGGGVEWAFAEDWSARLEYDYYDFGTHTATMNDAVNGPGPLSFKTTMQMVKLGVNFHVWGWQ